jgi:hypothetical protein
MARAKQEIDLHRCWVDRSTIGFGFTLYTLFARQVLCPAGFVWGNFTARDGKGTAFEVSGSYVPEWARRCGVRTRINEEIFKSADVIVTPAGTEDGKKFMRAAGYRRDPVSGFWRVPKPKRRRKSSN